jgi:23S rRNA pseudouridine1911/1915/1917 synthase
VRRALASFGRPALHAAELGLRHPVTGERMRWEAPLPSDIENLLQELRRYRDEQCAS